MFSNINLPPLIANIFNEQEPLFCLSITPKLVKRAAKNSFKSSFATNKLHSGVHSPCVNGHFFTMTTTFLNNYTNPDEIGDDMIEVFNTNVKSVLKLVDTFKAQSVNEEAIIVE